MLFPADLVRQKNNHATDSDIRIDNVSEETIGDALEDVGTKGSSDDDSTKAKTVIREDGRSEVSRLLLSHARPPSRRGPY